MPHATVVYWRMSRRLSRVSGSVGTHGQAAPVGAAVHPLHVHHGPEQADVVVGAAERLHALEQLGEQAGGHMTAVALPSWRGGVASPRWSSAGRSWRGAATGSGRV